MSGPEEFLLPPAQLTVPATPETVFPIRHSDWLQLRRKVANLKEPIPYLASVGWTFVGIAAAALVTLFPWVPAASQLPAKTQLHYSYVTPALAITALASAIIAILAFIVGHKVKGIRVTTVDSVLADMDATYEPYKREEDRRRPIWFK